ncbi:MAG: hypothetical protein AAB295_04590 [Chloroflexota bacterium]
MTRWTRAVAGLVLVCAAAAHAQGVSSPVLRGVLGMGKRAISLWEVPGGAGNVQLEVGGAVPGTPWKVAGVNLSKGQVWVYIDKKTPVLFQQGDTYLSGTKAVKAPDVQRPENRSIGEYRPPTPEEAARQRALAQAQHQQALARQKQAAATAAARPPASATGLIETVDVSSSAPPISSFARAGFLTAVMVTSPG